LGHSRRFFQIRDSAQQGGACGRRTSSLIVQQYQADGTVCRQTASPSLVETTLSVVHHQETRNRVSVPVDPTCTSRSFRAKLYIRWISGNTFFFEAGTMSHISIRPASS
jgi:hypothetical protein